VYVKYTYVYIYVCAAVRAVADLWKGYVCMCVCMYVCMCVCKYISASVYMIRAYV